MALPIRPGDVLLGKYQVEQVLGKGGMGVVVAARHLELGELFAIKLLLPEALESPQAVDRFVREARAAARLKGPHVTKVHDVGRLESGAPYMVMEYLEGTDLRSLLRHRGPLPIDEAIHYVLHACDAIAEAHGLGIVHRDLKPANLFLTRAHDGAPWIKVLDFGISKQMTSANPHDLTASGVILGSPLYMSPEQLVRTKQVDSRADIWALGIVLYELFTGTTPFKSDVLTEVLGWVLQEEPAPPSRLRRDLPAALDAIVLRCLQKRPEHRFQTMGELAAALRAFQTGALHPAAILPAASLVAREPPVAGPRPAFGSVPAPGNTAGGQTASAWGHIGAAPPAGHDRARAMIAVVLAGVVVVLLAAGGIWLAVRPGSEEGVRTAASAIPDVPPSGFVPSAPAGDPMPVALPAAPVVEIPPTTSIAPVVPPPVSSASATATPAPATIVATAPKLSAPAPSRPMTPPAATTGKKPPPSKNPLYQND